MRILVVADEESKYYWDYYRPGRLDGIDLILSCGDLKADYLTFLATMGHAPLLYVHGNHDVGYARRPPEGCVCVEDRVLNMAGLRILGLGGSPLYNGGAHQYTEKQMQRRINRLRWKLYRAGGVDIVLTHAPPRGYGDADDLAHRGFEAFFPLLDKYKPRYLIHGHVHMSYGVDLPRIHQYGETTLLNGCERYILDLPEYEASGFLIPSEW